MLTDDTIHSVFTDSELENSEAIEGLDGGNINAADFVKKEDLLGYFPERLEKEYQLNDGFKGWSVAMVNGEPYPPLHPTEEPPKVVAPGVKGPMPTEFTANLAEAIFCFMYGNQMFWKTIMRIPKGSGVIKLYHIDSFRNFGLRIQTHIASMFHLLKSRGITVEVICPMRVDQLAINALVFADVAHFGPICSVNLETVFLSNGETPPYLQDCKDEMDELILETIRRHKLLSEEQIEDMKKNPMKTRDPIFVHN